MFSKDDILTALVTVQGEIDSDDAFDETFAIVEQLGLESVPYQDIIELGRAFPVRVVGALLTVLAHGYNLDGALIQDARKWLFQCNDPYLVEIAHRQPLSLKGSFYNRRIRAALASAKINFPQLQEVILDMKSSICDGLPCCCL